MHRRSDRVHGGILAFMVLLAFLTMIAAGCHRMSESETKEILYGIHTKTPNMRDFALQRREKFISRAHAGRQEWESWARAHQDSLKKLKQTPLDNATFLEVYTALPSYHKTENVMSDPINSLEDSHDVRKIIFTWNAPMNVNGKVKYDDEVYRYVRKEAQSQHDVSLADSLPGGKSHITLWISGRVTETTWVDNLPHRSGQPGLREEVKEIEPAFDFLR